MPEDLAQSPELDDDFDDEDQDSGKSGRKKTSTNQAARPDQNRIAQREFRLRKQQRIRDLEARVEILSGTKEESQFHVRHIIQGLIDENSRLRTLVRDLGGFYGDGLGGPLLDKTGWSMQQFHEIVGRADTDTAYEAFVKAKQAMAHGGVPSSEAGGSSKDGDAARKRKRDSFDSGAPDSLRRNARSRSPGLELPTLLPSRKGSSSGEPRSFENLVDAFTSTAGAPFVEHLSNPGSSRSEFVMPSPYGSASNASFGMGASPSGAPATIGTPKGTSSAARQQAMRDNESKRQEAGKLIKYHLENYRRNENYFLPPSLRPTLVQRTVPHDPLIDGVLYPEIRDRMILLKDQFDLAQCLSGFITSVIVHGDDVLAHTNWEPSEEWLRLYSVLVDDNVLSATNKWRRGRGDHEVSMFDISPNNNQ